MMSAEKKNNSNFQSLALQTKNERLKIEAYQTKIEANPETLIISVDCPIDSLFSENF